MSFFRFHSAKLRLGKEPFDDGNERFGLGGGAIARDDLAIAGGEELGEVPLDAAEPDKAEHSGLLLAEKSVKRVGSGTVDVNFAKDGEADAVILAAEGANFFGSARLLAAELVAREAEHFKAAVFVSAIEGFEAGVLGREAAAAGGVDDKQDAAAKCVEGNLGSVEERRGKFVEGRWRFRHRLKTCRGAGALRTPSASKKNAATGKAEARTA